MDIPGEAEGKSYIRTYSYNVLNLSQTHSRAANYCRTSDNVRLNLANVRAKVILIGHWSDHTQKNCHIIHFFAVTKSDCKFTQFVFCNKIYEAF